MDGSRMGVVVVPAFGIFSHWCTYHYLYSHASSWFANLDVRRCLCVSLSFGSPMQIFEWPCESIVWYLYLCMTFGEWNCCIEVNLIIDGAYLDMHVQRWAIRGQRRDVSITGLYMVLALKVRIFFWKTMQTGPVLTGMCSQSRYTAMCHETMQVVSRYIFAEFWWAAN